MLERKISGECEEREREGRLKVVVEEDWKQQGENQGEGEARMNGEGGKLNENGGGEDGEGATE